MMTPTRIRTKYLKKVAILFDAFIPILVTLPFIRVVDPLLLAGECNDRQDADDDEHDPCQSGCHTHVIRLECVVVDQNGDEGGGTHLGKKILQYYLHDIFDKELKTKFESRYDFSKEIILENLYQKPLANRYLASFASFVFENRGHYMIENIAEDCLNDFFIHHLIRYPNIHKMPVHFSGSVAFFLKDIIKNLTEQYDIQLGVIIQKPMKGLIAFHSN